MSEIEYVQYVTPSGETRHRIKMRDRKTGKINYFKTLFELPVDTPLCEIIEEFGIPIIRIPGKQYKIRYVAIAEIKKVLGFKKRRFYYSLKKIQWIHPKENIKKKAYFSQTKGATHLPLTGGGSPLILVSIADAIQLLAELEKHEEKAKLIRKLIIKLEELQNKLNKHQKQEIENLHHILIQLDDVCYDWIKEHQENNIYEKGYKRLWNHQLWQIVIDIHRRIRDILGLPNPPEKYTGLHHFDRPYRKVYPHIATRCQLIDSRYDHNHSIQKKYIR